jgi:hypothetical protein
MLTKLTENYVAIPLRLVSDLRDNPVAIGLYALIARLYLIVQAPIALSRNDIQQYDPALKEGTVKRALDRLISAGWLAEAPGHKRRYVPTWGRSRGGIARPWQIGPRLGCPTHIFTTRLDKAILDTYMGKLTPHSRLPALIERYVSAPLLSLRDVGAYVLTAAGQPLAATAALYRWDLVHDGQALPIPATEQVLALASQRQQEQDAAPQLLPAGWARLGVPSMRPDHAGQPISQAQALFFAPKTLIGSLIPQMIADSIGCSSSSEAPFIPPESAESGSEAAISTMPENQGTTRQTSDSPPSPPQQIKVKHSGGSDSPKEKKTKEDASIPETASARLLWAINAHPKSIAELAELPPELVERAIMYAESVPGIASVPGWVVDALRRHRDEHWPIPRLRTRHSGEQIDVQALLSGTYGDLFRLGSDLSDVDCHVTNPERVQPDVQIDTQEHGSGRAQPGASAPAPNAQSVSASPMSHPDARGPAQSDARLQPTQSRSPEELTRLVCEELSLRCERAYHMLIRRLRVQVMDNRTVVRCASPADRVALMTALMGVLRWVIADLGLPATVHVTDGAPPAPTSEQGRAGARGQPAQSLPSAV